MVFWELILKHIYYCKFRLKIQDSHINTTPKMLISLGNTWNSLLALFHTCENVLESYNGLPTYIISCALSLVTNPMLGCDSCWGTSNWLFWFFYKKYGWELKDPIVENVITLITSKLQIFMFLDNLTKIPFFIDGRNS